MIFCLLVLTEWAFTVWARAFGETPFTALQFGETEEKSAGHGGHDYSFWAAIISLPKRKARNSTI